MNQQSKFNSPDLKGLLVNLVLSVCSLFVFLLMGSFALMHVGHFERFYSIVVYLCLGLTSLVISVLSKRLRGNFVLNAMISSLLISFIFIIVSLIFSPYGFSASRFVPCIFLICSSIVISYLLGLTRVKKYKHKKFSYKK